MQGFDAREPNDWFQPSTDLKIKDFQQYIPNLMRGKFAMN